MNIYARLFGEIRPHWKMMTAAMGWSVLMTLMEMVPPYLTAPLIDNALKNHPLTLPHFLTFWRPDAVVLPGGAGLLNWLCAALVFALVMRTVSHHIRMRFSGIVAHRVLYQVRTNLYDHLQKLSLAFYGNKRTGQIMSRVTNDVAILEQFIIEGVREFSINALRIVIIAAILFHTNPVLALLVLVPTIPLAWGTRAFQKRIRASYKTMRKRLADMNSILSDTIGGIRVVQIFGQEEFEADKFRHKSREFQTAGLSTQLLQAIFIPSVNLCFGVGQVIVWVVGGHQVYNGTLSVGHLVMFSGFVGMFYQPVQNLANTFNLFANTSTSGERIYEIMDTQPDIESKTEALALPAMQGKIEFQNVSFGYDSSENAISDLTLTIEPGQMVGLVGPSGSGKSTLVQLISRFYDIKEGSLKIDGTDVRDLSLRDLRAHISMVPQDPYLFHGTIRDNIAYGRPGAGFEEVMEAARAANAHEFIMKQPNGYDTHVGERGTKLSGGQRQRIAIARAILDDPRILILDEATSAVDTESEFLIQSALENLMKGRTTVAIAHRLSTVKNADKLVVLDGGRIAEEGAHDDLMEHDGGIYKKLVEMQTQLGKETVMI